MPLFGILWISRMANWHHCILFSFLDVLLMFLGKSEVIIPFFRSKVSKRSDGISK